MYSTCIPNIESSPFTPTSEEVPTEKDTLDNGWLGLAMVSTRSGKPGSSWVVLEILELSLNGQCYRLELGFVLKMSSLFQSSCFNSND